MKRSFLPLLLVGDLLALLAFVLVGQADHRTLNAANPVLGALPNTLSLAGPWLVLAWLLRAYPRVGRQPTAPAFLGRSALAWLVAAPLGLAIRALWLGRGGIPVPFLLVTLGAGGLFLLGWRLVFWALALRR
ncbi:MAG: DUF3054 domain-containing protein [Caldilineales bacterium]|nr:DUF3054 domain-containing protein [Caldilineales bacterium]MDW8318459.1 DUF3054 domain-containing protein [Anaerolineae bacterium]